MGPVERGVCAQHGRELRGGTPLWEYRLGLKVSKDKHAPKARAKPRGIVRREPECKRNCGRHSHAWVVRGFHGNEKLTGTLRWAEFGLAF